MNRLLRVLVAVACVLLVLGMVGAYRLVPRQKTPFKKAEDRAQRVVVEAPATGQRVELVKKADIWNVATSSGFVPAEYVRVKALLSSLSDVVLEDVISDSAVQASRFEVNKESATHVTLWGSASNPLSEGYFGKQAPDYTHLYFRFTDKPDVYLASGLFRGELNPGKTEDWKKVEISSSPLQSKNNKSRL